MKLCFVLPHYSTATDQHYFHLFQLIESLAGDFDIFVFAESGRGPVKISGIAGSHIQTSTFVPWRLFQRLFWFVKLRLRGYHTFYCHYAETSAIISALVTRILGGKTYKWHCVQEHYYQKPWRLGNLHHKLFVELPYRLAFFLVHYLVTCTPAMNTYYHRRFGLPLAKIKVLPNFVCLDRFKPYLKNKTRLKKKLGLPPKPLLLFVHHLSPRKGADRLIPLAQAIRDQNLNLHLVAVGDGPLRSKLKKLRTKHRLQHQLTLLGPVPNRHIVPYFQATDIFIMPSRVEEFGRVQLEAMACGLPIIATQTISSSSVLAGYPRHLILPQPQFTQIPQVANRLMHDQTQYRQLTHLALERAKIFSLNQVRKQFKQLFQTQ